MKFNEWIRHRIVGRLREPDYRELQEIAQKAKLLAGVYNHGELAKLIREYSHSEKAIEQIALLIAKSEPFDSPISTMKKESVNMMDVLTDTPFMAKHGFQLTDIHHRKPHQCMACSQCTPLCVIGDVRNIR